MMWTRACQTAALLLIGAGCTPSAGDAPAAAAPATAAVTPAVEDPVPPPAPPSPSIVAVIEVTHPDTVLDLSLPDVSYGESGSETEFGATPGLQLQCETGGPNPFVGESISGFWRGSYPCDSIVETLETDDPNFDPAKHYKVEVGLGGTFQPIPSPREPNRPERWWFRRTIWILTGEFTRRFDSVDDQVNEQAFWPWPSVVGVPVEYSDSRSSRDLFVRVTLLEDSFDGQTNRVTLHYEAAEYASETGIKRFSIDGMLAFEYEQYDEGKCFYCSNTVETRTKFRADGSVYVRVRETQRCAGRLVFHVAYP